MRKQKISRILEAREGIEPSIKVLQTFALPLGDRAPFKVHPVNLYFDFDHLEREFGSHERKRAGENGTNVILVHGCDSRVHRSYNG